MHGEEDDGSVTPDSISITLKAMSIMCVSYICYVSIVVHLTKIQIKNDYNSCSHHVKNKLFILYYLYTFDA